MVLKTVVRLSWDFTLEINLCEWFNSIWNSSKSPKASKICNFLFFILQFNFFTMLIIGHTQALSSLWCREGIPFKTHLKIRKLHKLFLRSLISIELKSSNSLKNCLPKMICVWMAQNSGEKIIISSFISFRQLLQKWCVCTPILFLFFWYAWEVESSKDAYELTHTYARFTSNILRPFLTQVS